MAQGFPIKHNKERQVTNETERIKIQKLNEVTLFDDLNVLSEDSEAIQSGTSTPLLPMITKTCLISMFQEHS